MRKYTVNYNFFELWSHQMAYILGFISADGNVYKNTLSIDLNVKDIEILEYVQKFLSPTKPFEIRKKSVRFRINSVDMIRSLKKYNIVKNKTWLIRADFYIPKEYLGDYIRGIFDGDGWVYLRRNSIESGICSASVGFLQDLRDICGGIGNIRKRVSYYTWDFCKNDTLKLRDIMYKNGGFSLKRKKAKFFSEFYVSSEKFWTKEQLKLLCENYNPKTKGCLSECANLIGKSYKAVSKKVWQLNLSS